jgi:hypothetical protein
MPWLAGGVWPIAIFLLAGLPIVFHVGGGGRLLDPNYFQNGLPMVTDFHGGAENFRSVDYMAIPFPPMQTLATMIFDRLFGASEPGESTASRANRKIYRKSILDFVREETASLQASLGPTDRRRNVVTLTTFDTATRNRSFSLDLAIILRTFATVLSGSGVK